jgi:flagellin
MSSVINTNIASLNAQRTLHGSQDALATSMQRLSSGKRINSFKDDAAGGSIVSRMESQIRGMDQAVRNASDGISVAQTAEGALGAIQTNLARMRELAVQASNATSGSDIGAINAEYTQLNAENTRVVQGTSFNGIQLLSRKLDAKFQVGANNVETVDSIMISTKGPIVLSSMTLGDSSATAQAELSKLDDDIAGIASARANFGAVQSRFESVIQNLQISSENQAAAKSRIMDTDYAKETAALARNQILQQAGTAMLAQANATPNSVLTLLRNN